MHTSFPKVALVTAVDTADGDLMAKFLLSENYAVHGVPRNALAYPDPFRQAVRQGVTLHAGDIRHMDSLMQVIQVTQPDEIYNMNGLVNDSSTAMSELDSADVDALGTLRLLQCIRAVGLEKKTRLLNASTSEMKEYLLHKHPSPCRLANVANPQVIAQLYAYLTTAHYREAYGMYACNGVWFNPESPCNGERLVTHHIAQSVFNMAHGHDDCLFVENFDTLRDWAPSSGAARMQWLMLQQPKASDSLLTTGAPQTLRQFISMTAAKHGIQLAFKGKGQDEYAVVVAVNANKAPALQVGQVVVGVQP